MLWGCTNESDTLVQDYIARGWAGVQMVPRKIWLDNDRKQTLQWRVGLLGVEMNTDGMN
jgi:beta-fructofuranosidase